MEIRIQPQVRKYINDSGEKEKIVENLKRLADDPFNSKIGADIKKLKGKKHEMYILIVGDHRFEYFIDEEKIWVDNAFRRGRGYR